MIARAARAALALAGVLLVVGGCTGTFEPGLPLALLVVEGQADQPSAVLGYAVDPPGPATPRAVRQLGVGTLTPDVAGTIVGLDWLDRDEAGGGAAGAGRTRLVVLVSDRAEAPGARSARLHGYDTTAFEVEAPAPFGTVGALTFDLVVAGAFQLPAREGVLEPDEGVCLNAVSVSLDGRYVALLDQRSACDGAAPPDEGVLLLVDTVERELVLSTAAAPVRGVAPLIDQARARVDFLTGTRMRSVSLADPDDAVESGALPDVGTLDRVQAFAPYGAHRLVVVDDRLYRIEPTGSVSPAVTTQPGADGIVETAPGLPILVRTPARLAVHMGPADDDERVLSRAYRAGTTDVADQLTYLVRAGSIDTLDLLVYDPGATDPVQAVVTSYPAPELVTPRSVTWFRPRPATP